MWSGGKELAPLPLPRSVRHPAKETSHRTYKEFNTDSSLKQVSDGLGGCAKETLAGCPHTLKAKEASGMSESFGLNLNSKQFRQIHKTIKRAHSLDNKEIISPEEAAILLDCDASTVRDDYCCCPDIRTYRRKGRIYLEKEDLLEHIRKNHQETKELITRLPLKKGREA